MAEMQEPTPTLLDMVNRVKSLTEEAAREVDDLISRNLEGVE